MKRLIYSIFFLLSISQSGYCQFNHKYIVSGSGMKEVKIISKTGVVEWTYPTKGKCNDVWQLSNGNVIFSDQSYAKEVTLNKETVWEFSAPKGTEIHTVSPIGNKFLIALNGTPSQIIELSKKGKILKTISFDTGIEQSHGQFRQVRKTPWGTYLAGTMRTSKMLEINKKGDVIREIPIKGQAFVGIPLPNKNILIACGEGHCIVEINQQNEIVWELKDSDIPQVPLRFIAGLHRLPNGNTIICNWGGHGHKGEQAQILEVTKDKKLISQVFDQNSLKEPSAIQILDMKRKPVKGLLRK